VRVAESLRGIPYFRQIDRAAVEALADSIEVLEYGARTVLWEQSPPTADLFAPREERSAGPAGDLWVPPPTPLSY